MANKIVAGIPLAELLDELLGHLDSVSVASSIAQAIAIADKDEESIHVQFKDGERLLDRPIIWWKHKWMADVDRRQRVKEQSDYDNKRLAIFKENVQRIAKKLHLMTQLPLENSTPLAKRMMLNALNTGDFSVLEKLGIYIEAIPPQRTDVPFSLDLTNIHVEGEK